MLSLSSKIHIGTNGHWISALDRMEDNPEFRTILDCTRKPSISRLYQGKWQSFIKFTQDQGLNLVPTSLKTILTFILHLFNLGLAHSTIKVYISQP